MLRHALANFKEESGLNKLKEKLSSNKKLKAFVLVSLVLLSIGCLFLSYKAKVLGEPYHSMVKTQEDAKNFAAICRIKPGIGMCVEFKEFEKVASSLSFWFNLWQIDFFVYWWLWVWKAANELIKKLKKSLSS
ncbi:hypothetical protein DRO91_05590 [Candidatus Heimdallarchaeota archaeon]|nr:MAG: hypothetical protein DRO91_05590 [Candidatus Heimdallarchaeota archaeon]